MKKCNARWQLAVYDVLILFVVDLLLVFYRSREETPSKKKLREVV